MIARRLRFGVTLALAVVVLSLGAANGDPRRGARVFQMCVSCHSVDPTEASKRLPGPALLGIFGRVAGTWQDFPDYSDFMIAAGMRGLVWNETTIDAYVADPMVVVPGTTMNFLGVPDAADRTDLIAYLKKSSVNDR